MMEFVTVFVHEIVMCNDAWDGAVPISLKFIEIVDILGFLMRTKYQWELVLMTTLGGECCNGWQTSHCSYYGTALTTV